MSKKQENKRYKYTNCLTECPVCGAPLSFDNYDCPACGANLVGYNEENNMANNLKRSADELSNLADKNDRLNSKIRNRNQYINKDKKTSNKIVKVVATVVVIIILLAILLPQLDAFFNKVSKDFKDYDEVVEYFQEYEPEVIAIQPSETVDCNVKTEEKYDNLGYDCIATMGYDAKVGITVIKEMYKKDNEAFSIVRQFNNDILYAPELDSLWYLRFDSNTKPFCFSDEIVDASEYGTIDEYILDMYVKDEDNLITKQKTMKIGEFEFQTYLIETIKEYRYNRFVAVAELTDDMFFESTISTSQIDNIKEVLENPEKYFDINFEKEGIENE
jgi:hypothetical protein